MKYVQTLTSKSTQRHKHTKHVVDGNKFSNTDIMAEEMAEMNDGIIVVQMIMD